MQHGHIGPPCWALTKPGSIHINFMRYKTMSNENNTNAPRPLTDAEKAKQAAALAASKGADQPKPGNVAPVTVDHKLHPQVLTNPGAPLTTAAVAAGVEQVKAQVTGAVAKPTSDTPDAVSAAIATLVKAAETVPANALIEGKGKATVLPGLTKPSTLTPDQVKAHPEQSKADALADVAAHIAAIAKANANVGKAQGGTKGKGSKTPTPTPVTAAKTKKLTK